MTAPEWTLWKQLRNHQVGYRFRRQHRLMGYVLDFYCNEAKLCVELDGEGHQTFGVARDSHRDRVLEEVGIKTLRFENWRVALELDQVVQVIRSECALRTGASGQMD